MRRFCGGILAQNFTAIRASHTLHFFVPLTFINIHTVMRISQHLYISNQYISVASAELKERKL